MILLKIIFIVLPFLDVLLDNHSNQGIITSVFHKKTYTDLLTNYFSFVPFSYKLGLVRTLVDRIFKINNTWAGFHLDINNLTKTLRKNSFPSRIIEHVVTLPPIPLRVLLMKTIVCILNYRTSVFFSIITQRTLRSELEIKLVFIPFKIESWFGAKDPIPAGLPSRVITSFHVQAVVPVIFVKPIDTLPVAFVNILPPTNILTSLST